MPTDFAVHNPFAIISFIAAPALLTNATSVLALSTSNRTLRSLERIRELTRAVAMLNDDSDPRLINQYRLQVPRAEKLCLHFMRALRLIYTSLACFAVATLMALIGATLFTAMPAFLLPLFAGLSLLVGASGILGVTAACYVLIQASRLATLNVQDDIRTMTVELSRMKNH